MILNQEEKNITFYNILNVDKDTYRYAAAAGCLERFKKYFFFFLFFFEVWGEGVEKIFCIEGGGVGLISKFKIRNIILKAFLWCVSNPFYILSWSTPLKSFILCRKIRKFRLCCV